ncbi:DNA sulfur modification protein DndD, ATPase [Halanaeroarchaeum sp. HSR-CO]|uniref:archaea-specific SMC-related protein n=1 Tax=Halanaeroarchaeum sp. HSR-CO TaxID=2866382 RepID=UPI00217EDFAA|nr:archaea-specific SMC-related protein [Halanaeroarchaeum sp. HSR-CO]UWG49079.1 DNA sulfur modification protein DndD, ATPase [Halanaeroarchaeum sp. HSR-CO]
MTWSIDIENIAGIERGSATLDEGVNAVRASNWQGKSSFLKAIKAAFGIGRPLTEGADRGRVSIESDDWTSTIALERDGTSVHSEGAPVLESEYDRVRVDLFAALDETNPIRRAVREGGDLNEVLTRPLDVEAIDESIAEIKRQRSGVETELERAREAVDRIPAVRERIGSLEAEIESLEDQQASIPADEGGSDTRDELSETRAERDRIADRIERLESTTERIEERLDAHRAELEGLEVEDPAALEEEIDAVREEYESVERRADLFQDLYTANKRFFESDAHDELATVQHDLLADTVECWICGQSADRSSIEASLETLGERVTDLREEVQSYDEQLESLESRRESIAKRRNRRDELERKIATLRERLADRSASLESARDRLAELEAKVEDLSAAVETETDALTDVESELKYTRSKLTDRREELSDLEAEADRLETLEEEYDEMTAEIERLRTRKERVRRETREAFKRQMNALLEVFETGFEAARLTDSFELVVARHGRETNLDALSQGERELLGIVVGIAGYEAFDVASVLPVLLLDNLGVLTDRNVEALIEQLRPRAEYIVFTSYPEHTAFAGHEIDVGDWEVVSGDQSVDTGV